PTADQGVPDGAGHVRLAATGEAEEEEVGAVAGELPLAERGQVALHWFGQPTPLQVGQRLLGRQLRCLQVALQAPRRAVLDLDVDQLAEVRLEAPALVARTLGEVDVVGDEAGELQAAE